MMVNTIKTATFSFAGKRAPNQDSVSVDLMDDQRLLLVVADGMGGEFGGDIASSLAVDVVRKLLRKNPETSFADVFAEVQRHFLDLIEQNSDLSGMGTTLTVCVVCDHSVRFGHVGDSRLYHLRGRGLVTKTKDQTELQRLIDDGVISKARAHRYNRKNILLSVMSAHRKYDLQIGSFKVEPGDRLLLLTDGVYSLIRKRELIELSGKSSDPERFVEDLRAIIEGRKIKDDCSVICCEITM